MHVTAGSQTLTMEIWEMILVTQSVCCVILTPANLILRYHCPKWQAVVLLGLIYCVFLIENVIEICTTEAQYLLKR